MITIEKLLFLKSVNLFKAMPDDLLLQVATDITREKRVAAGETILEKAQINPIIYIIASGTFRVHDENDCTIVELHSREIFGELSALTREPTVSFVSALDESLLLTIPSDALYDLMNLEVELSKGIIRALCERTQDMSFQIQQMLLPAKSN